MNSIVTVRAGGLALILGALSGAINNYLLPIWMIALGIILLRHRERPAGAIAA